MSTPLFTGDQIYRDDLAACALYLLRQREASFPRQIEAGKLTAAIARAKLETTRCLVAQWCWITDPSCPALPPMDRAGAFFGEPSWTILAEVERLAATCRARADHANASDHDATIADQCAALLYWQQPAAWSRAGAFARIVSAVDYERSMSKPWRSSGLPVQQERNAA